VETGSGGTAGAIVAATVAATAAATSCCNPTASAALSAALDALDERRLVGTDVPDLSTLAGARSGTIGTALSTWRQEFGLQPFKTRTFGEAAAYLKVEKPRFLFLEVSTDAEAPAGVATTALLDASTTRVAPSIDRLVLARPRHLSLGRLRGSR
jgi:hypothetical protein